MAPRNNDANPNYKKACPSTEEDDSELDVATFIPSLLHKKHKVVKLVRSQLKKIQEEGLLNCQGFTLQDDRQSALDREKRSAWMSQTGQISQVGQAGQPRQSSQPGQPGSSLDQLQDVDERNESGTSKCMNLLVYLLAIILFLLLIILLAVWISAGPLSNPMAYTPIPPGSFVRTDGLCSLEKKYLLRWSNKPDYL